MQYKIKKCFILETVTTTNTYIKVFLMLFEQKLEVYLPTQQAIKCISSFLQYQESYKFVEFYILLYLINCKLFSGVTP